MHQPPTSIVAVDLRLADAFFRDNGFPLEPHLVVLGLTFATRGALRALSRDATSLSPLVRPCGLQGSIQVIRGINVLPMYPVCTHALPNVR